MSIFKKLLGKPNIKSLGDGLQIVKKKMNAVGENLSTELGTRLYRTPCNNIVSMHTGGSLCVEKILSPFNKIKDYIGKIAGFKRSYRTSVKPGDGKVSQVARTSVCKFSNKGSKFFGYMPETDNRAVKEIFDNAGYKSEDKFLHPIKMSSKITRKRVLPYETAVSQGLKI